MGCGSSMILDYIVQFCDLIKLSGQNSYKINLIIEQEFKKIESIKMLDQIRNSDEPEIKKFFQRPNFQSNTIFYYYLSDEPILKTYNQSIKYVPYNSPLLSKIIILSTDFISEFPIQIIENETKHLEKNEFIKHIFYLDEIKKELDIANNPNITKDSLSLKDDSLNYDDESIIEKEGEIIISEEITRETFINLVSQFENYKKGKNNNININLETSADNHNINDDKSHKIKTVKIFASKLDNIVIFHNIMEYLSEQKIKKFLFFENNINSDFEGWDSISEFFENNFSLRYIDLHSSCLYDYHLDTIAKALINKRIRYLNLSENFLTIDGIEIIANILKYNKTLQKLNLCRNAQCQFKAEGVKLITEALILNPNIVFLDFSYMNLTGCGEAIGNFISNNKSIESIHIRSVQLNIVDFKNIFVALITNKVLKEIDISLNDMGGDKSLEYIADAIKVNKTLTSIKMDRININNDNYHIIFDAIEKNDTIISYSFNYNSKIKPLIMLNFFIKQKQVKLLEYDPFDRDNIEDKKKELTLEEKKMFVKLKTERPDMKIIYK